jgi:hypothetical protein
MQQLSDLQKSDPAKFKLVVEEISQKFGQLASSKVGAEADGLSRLAEAFKKTADTGDLTSISPEGNRGHGTPQARGEGQGARVAEQYRKNGPPPPAPQSREDAFTQALSIVGAASGTQQASASSSAAGNSSYNRAAAVSGARAA